MDIFSPRFPNNPEISRLAGLLSSPEKTSRLLADTCWDAAQGCPCPSCGSTRLYRLGTDRAGCARCEIAWTLGARTWLRAHNLTYVQWAALLQAEALCLDARSAAGLIGTPCATAYRAQKTVRLAVACLDSRWIPWAVAAASGSPWPGALRVEVRDRRLNFEPSNDVPELRLIRSVRDWLAIERDPDPELAPAIPFIRSLRRRARGFSGPIFTLFLKSCELRYNAQQKNVPLFELLMNAVCQPVPTSFEETLRLARHARAWPGR